MSEVWGAWSTKEKRWHTFTWKRGIKIPQWVTRRETAEMLVKDLGEGWIVMKKGATS